MCDADRRRGSEERCRVTGCASSRTGPAHARARLDLRRSHSTHVAQCTSANGLRASVCSPACLRRWLKRSSEIRPHYVSPACACSFARQHTQYAVRCCACVSYIFDMRSVGKFAAAQTSSSARTLAHTPNAGRAKLSRTSERREISRKFLCVVCGYVRARLG